MLTNSKTVSFAIPLGVLVRCTLTGLIGKTNSVVERLNGCLQYSVQPEVKPTDTDMPKGWYLDEQQLECVEKTQAGNFSKLKKQPKGFKHTFAFNTGDKVKGKMVKFEGHITSRCYDLNGCEQYMIILPDLDDKGEEKTLKVFPQELERVDAGINKKVSPVKRERTGCAPIMVGSRHK